MAGGVAVALDVREVLRSLEKLERAADMRVRTALSMFAQEVADHAKQNHGYTDRTGKLTTSIRAGQVSGTFGTGLRVDIIAGSRGVNYAPYVEFGTSRSRPFRFMQNALQAKLPRAEQLIEDALDLAAREAGLT